MTNFLNRSTLNTILYLDAMTCTAMGALLVLASGPIGGLTDIPSALLFWAGLVLLPVAIFMAIAARGPRPAWMLRVIVAGNVLWVVASLVLPATGAIAPNALGWIFILAQAVVVALIAAAEWSARSPAAAAA
ncbi:hypothetical protein [Pseudooceanicola algae]|uniref:Integral membrane protein n=1 Tax=Pseudooceanicola algae TaxID=1537215 RepID=A0A418SK24_9RHOB|nr:hypothetical protein [Pseudooceanicola algae]QPM92172.1 hypothetical protein PSAL_034360 [Pseudooceanicola algae]